MHDLRVLSKEKRESPCRMSSPADVRVTHVCARRSCVGGSNSVPHCSVSHTLVGKHSVKAEPNGAWGNSRVCH